MDRAQPGTVPHVRDASPRQLSPGCLRGGAVGIAVTNMKPSDPKRERPSNLRLGLLLGAVAVAFFCAVIVKKILIG